MVLLLFIAAGLTAVSLTLRFKLESFREVVRRDLAQRTGIRASAEVVAVNGVRGFRVEGLRVETELDEGPLLRLECPEALIHINIIDVLHGELSVDRVELREATMVMTRPEGRKWFSAKGLTAAQNNHLLELLSFRLIGENCELVLQNVVADTHLTVNKLSFDVSKLVNSERVTVLLAGSLDETGEKIVDVEGSLRSLEDFNFRISCSRVTTDDINVFLPAQHHLIQSGTARPVIRATGFPGEHIVVSLDMPYEGLEVRGLPTFIGVSEGTITGLASYRARDQLLSITTAKVEGKPLAGELGGYIDFASEHPRLDLEMKSSALPFQDLISHAFGDRIDRFGAIELDFTQPYEVVASLRGTTQSPVVTASGAVSSGTVRFNPATDLFPSAELGLGSVGLVWDSSVEQFELACSIEGGELRHAWSGLTATSVSGRMGLVGSQLDITSISAEVTGRPFLGNLSYDFETEQGAMTVNGGISGMEHTFLHDFFDDTLVSGAAMVKAEVRKQGDRVTVTGETDATQSDVEYNWWLHKPAGVGASADIRIDFTANERCDLDLVKAHVAGSDFEGAWSVEYLQGRWRLKQFDVRSDHLDIQGVNRCLRMPYTLNGGTATKARYRLVSGEPSVHGWEASGGAFIDELTIQPEGIEHAMRMEGLDLSVELTKGYGKPTGLLRLNAHKASTPPLKKQWFVPLRTNPELLKRFPPVNRNWTYELKATEAVVPPWQGRNFTGNAYLNEAAVALETFSADVGQGSMAGSYTSKRAENAYEVALEWEDTPTKFFLDYLGYPDILSGLISGNLDYQVDRDDPGTLRGKGHFAVRDGQFGADFLYGQLQGRMQEKASALPPSLTFASFSSDVAFDGDTVRTPNVVLDAEGIDVRAQGQFVRGGDVDYTLQVAVSPDTAERIPVLNEHFNIQGHRLAQQDITLAFNVAGPAVSPRGELAELPPIRVTLVSGALEVASEAAKVIDIPRRILVDLLNIGGGIVGAKPRQEPRDKR